MDHVPDRVLAALDDLGRGLLVGKPTTVDEQLRRDLRLKITCGPGAITDGAAPIVFRLEHTATLARLRDHGSYVCTIIDNIESQLRAWGLGLPPAYAYQSTEDGWQVYAGTLKL